MISILDWPIASIYFTLILTFSWFGVKKGLSFQLKKIRFFALLAHILGGIAFAFTYVYYYGGGDTLYYFSGGQKFMQVLFEDPIVYFQLLFTDFESVPPELAYYVQDIQYFRSNELWLMVRITSVVCLLGGGLFLPTTILFSVLGFYANWMIYQVFHKILKSYHWLVTSILFLPSVVFWGNGIMKDTVVFLGVGYSFYYLAMLIGVISVNRTKKIVLAIVFIWTLLITLTLKSYVVAVFLLVFVVTIYVAFYKLMKQMILRIAFSLLSIVAFVFLLVFLQNTILGVFETIESEVVDTLKGFHSWHTERGGSVYNLGEMEYTTLGMLTKAPAAINVTYFRPYPWELSSPFMVMTFVESVFFLVLLLYGIYKVKRRTFFQAFKNPIFLFAFIFAILFGFIVGLTSYNFGALARYKLIALPFYVAMLVFLLEKQKVKIKK